MKKIKDFLINSLKKSLLFKYIKQIKLLLIFGKTPNSPALQSLKKYKFESLGSKYGSWTFIDEPRLKKSTIISAGLGEDASFDLEFASLYNATVIVVDPTPRAIAHFNAILEHLGQRKTCNYLDTGKQPVEAYDLRRISSDQLRLVRKALWNENKELMFFEPANPKHVSHSIINYQNNYRENTNYIKVQSSTITNIIAELGVKKENIFLVKLDIEGAEIEVITDFLEKGFQPPQILVEFDEIRTYSIRGIKRVISVNKMLRHHDYECVWNDGDKNFLYVILHAFGLK